MTAARLAAVAAAALGLSAVAMADGTDDLVRLGRADLEALYRAAEPGPVPAGFTPGRAIYSAGPRPNPLRSRLTGLLWKGKVFPDPGTMVNRLPFGLEAVPAAVYPGESWLDGRPTLVLDYAPTSRLFGAYRDEMREVSPGVYLGLTYRRRPGGCPELAVFFALDARGCR